MPKAKLGIAPIAWSNDDLPELGGDTSLETCLKEAREAGFTGIETGGKFPQDPAILGPILEKHDIRLAGGWYCGTVLKGDLEAEKDRIRAQMDTFKALGAPCIVYGEWVSTIQNIRSAPLTTKCKLDEAQIATYGRNLTAFAEWCADQGMPIAFHHHMSAVIETEPELDLLMEHSGPGLPLLFDAGHMAFAGGDVFRVIDKHHSRITHVHAKDVRRPVVDALDRSRESFLDAVLKGAFTVPGDGDLDFEGIVKRLADHGYEGWFVVEAEQDPVANPPSEMARIGYNELRRVMATAGYDVEE
jgi:inosose dehydratase